jgi:hypothetical protein
MFANGWKTLFLLSFLLFARTGFADDITIFDVRNTQPLSDKEPIYKDYYLNAGSEKGLRAGMVITVIRKMALYDSYQNKSPGELQVQVGKIKLIYVQKNISVARDFAAISRAASPLLDNDFVMVGDGLDLDSMTMDKGTKSAEAEPAAGPAPTEAAETPATAAAPNAPAPAEEAAKSVEKAPEPQASQAAVFSTELASKASAAPLPANEPAPATTLQ